MDKFMSASLVLVVSHLREGPYQFPVVTSALLCNRTGYYTNSGPYWLPSLCQWQILCHGLFSDLGHWLFILDYCRRLNLSKFYRTLKQKPFLHTKFIMTKSIFPNFKKWTTDAKCLQVILLLTLLYPVFITSFCFVFICDFAFLGVSKLQF